MANRRFATDSSTDSPGVSTSELSSPLDNSTQPTRNPNLRIKITSDHQGENEETTKPKQPLTAGLETGRIGQYLFGGEALDSFDDYYNDLNDPPELTEENRLLLEGAEGAEDAFGSTEEEHDPGPNLDDFFWQIQDAEAAQSADISGHGNNVDLAGTPLDPNIGFNDLHSSTLPPQLPGDSAHEDPSSSHQEQHIPNFDPNVITPSTEATLTTPQQQVSYPHTESNDQAASWGLQSVHHSRGTHRGASRFSPYHMRQTSQPSSHRQQRPPTSEPSTLQQWQQQRQQRNHSQRRIDDSLKSNAHLNTEPGRSQSSFQSGYQPENVSYGLDQGQQYLGNYGHPRQEDTRFSQMHPQYSRSQSQQTGSYASAGWHHDEQERHNRSYVQHNPDFGAGHSSLYGGSLELLQAPFLSEEISRTVEDLTTPDPEAPEQGLFFDSIEAAKQWRKRHLVQSGNTDSTIPTHPNEQKRVVKKFLSAIKDTSTAMSSSFVKYFEESKYSDSFLESICWALLVWHSLRNILLQVTKIPGSVGGLYNSAHSWDTTV